MERFSPQAERWDGPAGVVGVAEDVGEELLVRVLGPLHVQVPAHLPRPRGAARASAAGAGRVPGRRGSILQRRFCKAIL